MDRIVSLCGYSVVSTLSATDVGFHTVLAILSDLTFETISFI